MLVAAAAVAGVLALAVPVTTALRDGDEPERGVTGAGRSDDESRRLLQGTWVTRVVAPEEVARRLEAAGLGDHADAVTLAGAYPTAWNVAFDGDRYLVRSASGVTVDAGTRSVDGDLLLLRPSCDACRVDLRWTLSSGALRLDLVADVSPDLGGVPSEAYSRALWTTVPFHRFAT